MEKINVFGLSTETCIVYDGDINHFTIVEDFYEHEEGVYFDPYLHQYCIEKSLIGH